MLVSEINSKFGHRLELYLRYYKQITKTSTYSSIPPLISGKNDDSSGLNPFLKPSSTIGSSPLPFSLALSFTVLLDSLDDGADDRLNSLSVPLENNYFKFNSTQKSKIYLVDSTNVSIRQLLRTETQETFQSSQNNP